MFGGWVAKIFRDEAAKRFLGMGCQNSLGFELLIFWECGGKICFVDWIVNISGGDMTKYFGVEW